MGEDWRKDDHRKLLTVQLAKAMSEYEGIGYNVAQEIERGCYAAAKTKVEYLDNLAMVLLGANRGDMHAKCDICIFLERVTDSQWTLVGDIDF